MFGGVLLIWFWQSQIFWQLVLRFLCSHLVKDPILKPHEWWRKALSALALLFSIIRVKTIPFVILDEVEAA